MSRLLAPGGRRTWAWRRWLAVLGATALAILASVGKEAPPQAFTVEAQPVPLNPSDPQQSRIGALRYRGGLWLRSPDPRFGGLSGLRLSPDGERMVAVSDCGRAFTALLEYDGKGNLAGLRAPTLHDLAGPGGRALDQSEIDAEDLVEDGHGGLLVAFEGERPHIWRYGMQPPLAGPARPWAGPPFGVGCEDNHGPEALAELGGGRYFVACEGAAFRAAPTTVWLGRDGHWTPRPYPLEAREAGLGEVFRPTAATLLPDGDVMVIERRFPPIEARLMRLAKADLEGEGPLAPREVARLAPPLTVDNLEGVDARRDATGATILYLVSDNNGCGKNQVVVAPRAVQRTLLLVFELLPG